LVLDENYEFPAPEGEAIVLRRRVGQDVRDYESGLRSAIKQNPDVIMVGDASSPRTFDLALRAAESGRLVIAAVPAHSVQALLVRILNFYPAHDLAHI